MSETEASTNPKRDTPEDLRDRIDDDDDEETTSIWYNVRRTTERPGSSCAFMCGMWVLTFAALIVLSMAVGTLEFELGVPFYDRAEINQEREDSYKATQRDADWVARVGSGSASGVDCVHESPTILTRNGTLIQGPMPSKNCQRSATHTLNLLFISKDRTSNVLTPENLAQIQQVEDYILGSPDLSKRCNLVDSNFTVFEDRNVSNWQRIMSQTMGEEEKNHVACKRISSPLNFMDPLYFDTSAETGLGYYLIDSDVIPQDYVLEQNHIDSVIEYWSEYPQMKSYNVSSLTGTNAAMIVPNLFHKVVSSEFTTGSSGAVGVISSYPLGLPIHGYSSSSESRTEQFEETGQWLWDEFDSYLKSLNLENIDVYFADSEGGMAMAEGGYLALVSFSFFPASIAFVFLYLTYMQDSFFIGLVGIMQILLSFLPGIVLYRYVIQQVCFSNKKMAITTVASLPVYNLTSFANSAPDLLWHSQPNCCLHHLGDRSGKHICVL